MAWQLIYTSALRTLVPGQSGYGTVARSTDLREALIQRLEQLSYYQHIGAPGTGATTQSHVVSAYRILDFRGSRYLVLTRIQDAGLDFTSRTNHLAHHLVFEPAELAGVPPPAIILSQWSGWRSRWEEGPRFLEEADWGDLRTLPRGVLLPAAAWRAITGDAGSAAGLLVRPYAAGCNLLCQAGEEATLLTLFAESLQLLDPDCRHPVKLWEHTFTTFFQAEDSPSDFIWRGCVEGTPGWQAIQRTADGVLVPLRTVAAPANQLAKLAREGRPQIVVPAKTGTISAPPSPASSPTTLRLESRQPTWRKPPVSAPPSPARSAATPRMATFDFTSPRFWLPALLLLLVLLLGALVWPGYLKSRWAGRSRSVSAPTNADLSAADSGSLLPDSASPAGSQRGKPKLKPSDEAQSPLPREALDELNKQIDKIATWVIVLDKNEPFTFPKSTELDGLLRKRLFDAKPLEQIVECQVAERRVDLSGAKATAAILESDFNETGTKQIAARFPSGARLVLDCGDWFRANKNSSGANAPVKLKWASAPPAGVFTVLLRPVSDLQSPTPCRLVIFSGKAPSPSGSIQLSKTLLRQNRVGLDALAPELHAQIKAIQFGDTRLQWQLRSSTARLADSDLIDSLEPAFRPAAVNALDFAAMREQITSRLAKEQARETNLVATIEQLQRLMQDDPPVGQMLSGCTNELASLGTFVKTGKQRRFDRQTYVEYLRGVLSGISTNLARHVPNANATEAAAKQAFGKLQEALENKSYRDKVQRVPPPGYLFKQWENLGRIGELEPKQTELQKAHILIARYETNLRLVPPSFAAAPRVSLFLVGGNGQRFEIIRFTDASPKSAP